VTCNLVRHGLLAALVVVTAATTSAQEIISKEAAEALKAPFIEDSEELKTKFVQLTGAFPDDKLTWRPMPGVRSVAEVLALIALELNGFVPQGWGGKEARSREEMLKLRTSTNKAELIAAINQAFDHAKAQITAADPATLTGRRQTATSNRSLYEFALMISGDMHEHLGQLIAYARMNNVVPPWSK
jgi:DinB superfamily